MIKAIDIYKSFDDNHVLNNITFTFEAGKTNLIIGKSGAGKTGMKMGMLFQGNALFDSMTVEENIRFPMDMFTTKTSQEKLKQVDYCLERVSLSGINNKYPSEISGGMQKRVGIARAIVLNPKYLFCDEPNSGLDPKTAITIDELISGITRDNNITTIINTHDMNSVMEIGDNICLLSNQRYLGQKMKLCQILYLLLPFYKGFDIEHFNPSDMC